MKQRTQSTKRPLKKALKRPIKKPLKRTSTIQNTVKEGQEFLKNSKKIRNPSQKTKQISKLKGILKNTAPLPNSKQQQPRVPTKSSKKKLPSKPLKSPKNQENAPITRTISINPLLQDRQFRLCQSLESVALRKGEKLIKTIENVEDQLASPNTVGTLQITNLRLIWICKSDSSENTSIGYNIIKEKNTKFNKSKEILSLQLQWGPGEYFIDLSCGNTNKKLSVFKEFHESFENYVSSRLHRDFCENQLIFNKKGDIEPLMQEKVLMIEENVAKVTENTKKNVDGTLVLTNIRVIWYAKLNKNKQNLSLPYVQIKQTKENHDLNLLSFVFYFIEGYSEVSFEISKQKYKEVYEKFIKFFVDCEKTQELVPEVRKK